MKCIYLVQLKHKTHRCHVVSAALKLSPAFYPLYFYYFKKKNYLQICFTAFKSTICMLSFLLSEYQSQEPTGEIKVKTRFQR